jgi:hypothetical protein
VLEAIGRRLPSPLALFFVALAGGVSIALAFLKGLQDPDYFWHLKTGELIATSGIPTTDPFSFTYGGEWTLHEWLGELLIYWLDRLVGPVGSLALFGLLPPAALAVAAFAARRFGAPTRAIVFGTLLAAAVLLPYVTVRPQAFSWLLLAVLISLLLGLRPGERRGLLALPLLFVIWANLHGLYVIGLGVLGLYAVATLLGRTPMAARPREVLGASVAAVLASAITPAGPAGLLYPLRYVDSGDWGLANIPEWQSPNFHDLVQLPLLVLILATALVAHRGPIGWLKILAYLSIAGALLANRNAPVAAVATLPALALGLANALPRNAARPTRDAGARRAIEAAVASLVAVGALLLLPAMPGARGVIHTRYPQAAVARLAEVQPASRVLAEYGWAGYVIAHLADSGTRVFVDGRNDMYPDEILAAYSTLLEAFPGWVELLERHRVDAILFPPDATLVKGIAQAEGWCEQYRDARQVLLLPCR